MFSIPQQLDFLFSDDVRLTRYAAYALIILFFLRWLLKVPPPLAPKLESTLRPRAFERVDPIAELKLQGCGSATHRTYAVLGVGFVGRCLVETLLDRGEGSAKNPIICIDFLHVSPFETTPYHVHSARNFLKPVDTSRIEYVRANVTKLDDIKRALDGRGIDVVFMTAALIAFYERLDYTWPASYEVNVRGAANAVEAMVECGVPYLVFTSTSHTVLRNTDNEKDRIRLDETAPYVTRQESCNHYGVSKAMAERIVLEANGRALKKKGARNGETKLHVVSIRPVSGVYGYGDKTMLNRLLAGPKNHTLYTDPNPYKFNVNYVANVVHGELLAEHHLIKSTAAAGRASCKNDPVVVAGEAFHVGGPVLPLPQLYEWAMDHWPSGRANCESSVTLAPSNMIKGLAFVSEFLQWASGGRITPYLGDLAVLQPATTLMCELYYSMSDAKARRVLNYREIYTPEEACQRTSFQYYEEDRMKRVLTMNKKMN